MEDIKDLSGPIKVVGDMSHQSDRDDDSTGFDSIPCHPFKEPTNESTGPDVNKAVVGSLSGMSESSTKNKVDGSDLGTKLNVTKIEREKVVTTSFNDGSPMSDINEDLLEADKDIKIKDSGTDQVVDSKTAALFNIKEDNNQAGRELVENGLKESELSFPKNSEWTQGKIESKIELSHTEIQGGVDNFKTESSIQETEGSRDYSWNTHTKMNEEGRTLESSYVELQSQLKTCKEELDSTKKQLARAERQVEKANAYNEDLRKQVECLSAEIHKYRHSKTQDIDIQVDKDELLSYATGELVLPDWGTSVQGSSDAADTNTGGTSAEKTGGEKLSIAESLKATAEAVVLQQSGFVYDENSGLYYDYNTGYYYDNEKSLYYDPNSGTYFYYNHETNEYQFHSQVDVTCYQWQHQSGAHSTQFGGSGGTTQLEKEKSADSKISCNQHQIESKGKLKNSEKKRKERKKEKAQDEQIYKNRKERRKALMEKIEEKRKKKEKKKKEKHHRHRKRKKNKKEIDEKEEIDKYVEDKMRKRSKKKRKHKKEKDKHLDIEVIEEESNMQWECLKGETQISGIDDKAVHVIDSTGTDKSFDVNTMSNKTPVCLEQSSNLKAREAIDAYEMDCDNHSGSSDSDIEDTRLENKSAPCKVEGMVCDTDDGENDCVLKPDAHLQINVSNKDLHTDCGILEAYTRDAIQEEQGDRSTILKRSDSFGFDSEKSSMNVIQSDSVTVTKTAVAGHIEDNTNTEMVKEDTNSLIVDDQDDDLDLEVIESENDEVADDIAEVSAAAVDNSIVISSDSESEMESGEISETENSECETDSISYHSTDSSLDSDSDSDNSDDNTVEEMEDWNQKNELSGGWPPCIRVIVTESNCLAVGTLFIVTCTGGTVGREKDMNHAIRIPDINVSKMHAEIQFDGQRGQYEIFDRGSQNGTFINDHRVAEAKEESLASPINHGDILHLGDTKLLCHIHPGSDTCDNCEPGIVIANHLAKQPQKRITILSKEEKKQQQKQQLKEIKKKYGLKNAAYVDNTDAINNPRYTDKASERRKTAGSEGPGFVRHEAPASVHRPISSENIGHKLLKKMGWSEGESLGKEKSGIQEPVTVTLRANQTAGLGSSTAVYSPDDANSVNVKKAARRVQAQQRFNKLQTETSGNQSHKPQTDKQWTKGETQYADGGNG